MQLAPGVSNNLIFLYLHSSFIAFTESFLPLKASVCFHVAGGWDELPCLVCPAVLSPWSPSALPQLGPVVNPDDLCGAGAAQGELARLSLMSPGQTHRLHFLLPSRPPPPFSNKV